MQIQRLPLLDTLDYLTIWGDITEGGMFSSEDF